jgi:TM2 domain-containing membrane protein YozV
VSPDRRERSRAVATWLAVLGGSLGLHRFYLHGARDAWAWLHSWPTLVGAYGFWRLRQFGLDDVLGSRLVPLLGAMVAIGMLAAIVYGLAPAARWRARYGEKGSATGWATVIGVVVALAVGATATMATIAYTAQRYFELRAP